MFILLAMLPAVATLLGLLSLLAIVPMLWARAEGAYTPGHEGSTWALDLDAELDTDAAWCDLIEARALALDVDAAWTETHFYGVLVHEAGWAAARLEAEHIMQRKRTKALEAAWFLICGVVV